MHFPAFVLRPSGAAAQPRNRARSGVFLWPRAAAGLAVALALAGCSRQEAAPEPVRAVKLVTVGAHAAPAPREYAGEVRARVESRLSFRVAGKIVQRPVEAGQHVRAGQLLAELDARDYELAAQAARAQVAAASTQRDLAAAEFERFSRLHAQNFISGAELDRRQAALKSAQAQLAQAQAQLAAQGNQAGYTRLLADAPGVVTGVDAEVGQVVAAGTPVVRIARDGERDAVFAVPEDRVAGLRVGQPVQVAPWAGGPPLAGKVREVAASADPVTRTFAVKVALQGAEPPPLGATVQVRLADQAAPAAAAPLRVPAAAVWQDAGRSAVWVFDPASSTVRAQPVQLARLEGDEVLLAGGLADGAQVVAAGVHVLAPGQKVTVYQPKTPQALTNKGPAAMNPEAPTPAPGAAR
ncbi:RND family efflux transporter, MFP subunit [Oryzisolibacter propanilivorax]|uniref:RND family efflux transporter, MFP subunit n=1 Tax=Oryzisolibacter propanilivorax TaxID=1527607 RepID=A0A1G9NYS7_9BURK|nr:RND family efflux transporter, MFP subunit [Oryzisolibacter propanilivorax]